MYLYLVIGAGILLSGQQFKPHYVVFHRMALATALLRIADGCLDKAGLRRAASVFCQTAGVELQRLRQTASAALKRAARYAPVVWAWILRSVKIGALVVFAVYLYLVIGAGILLSWQQFKPYYVVFHRMALATVLVIIADRCLDKAGLKRAARVFYEIERYVIILPEIHFLRLTWDKYGLWPPFPLPDEVIRALLLGVIGK